MATSLPSGPSGSATTVVEPEAITLGPEEQVKSHSLPLSLNLTVYLSLYVINTPAPHPTPHYTGRGTGGDVCAVVTPSEGDHGRF